MQNIIEGNAILFRGRKRDYMVRSERRPGYRVQPPRKPQKSGKDKAYLAATIVLLILLYPIGLVLLWLRRLKWHTLVKLLVSVLAGAIFFLWISMAATLETDNPALVRVQEGIRTGYEAVGNAADAVGNWFAEGWNATVAEANHNLAIVREQGPSALEHALHAVGDAAWNAYNWAADLLGVPALDTPTTPEPLEEATPLPLFATATPNPSALVSASPTPSPTPAPTPSPTPAPTLQPIGRVTVYSVENGTYYHMNDTCRNMEGGIPGTLEDAVAAGLSPCSRCGVPRASILNEEEPLVYLDEEMLYHTSVNCDAFTGAWTPQTLMLAFYRGYEACPVCGADHYVYQPEEPFTQAMDAARHITVYYHDNSTYYHAESSCGSMTGADPHSLAEAVLLDEKERCPSCDPPEIGAEATEAPEPSAQSEP